MVKPWWAQLLACPLCLLEMSCSNPARAGTGSRETRASLRCAHGGQGWLRSWKRQLPLSRGTTEPGEAPRHWESSRYKLTRGSQEICQLLVRSWIPNSRLWRNKLEGLTSGESPGRREFRALEKAAGRRLCLLPSGVSQEVWFSSQGYCVQVASFPSVGPGANTGINLGFTASEQGRVPWCCCFTDRE